MSTENRRPRAPLAPVQEVWKLLIEKYGLSYEDVRLVCAEVADRAR